MVKGYKVFNPDWTCREKQYTCPGKFEEEVELDVCGHGMYFCQTAADCFNYYTFDSDNKVAEVIAYGEVLVKDSVSITNKLEIVREISWNEVLRMANFEKKCTGYHNIGFHNTGSCNVGNQNAGDYNTDDGNTGDYNAGGYNSGNRNTGNYNTGSWNVGDCNTGNFNTGDYNVGGRNTGKHNTGNRNTGDWNKSSFNTGCFNTEEQKITLFNKPSNITYTDWCNSDASHLLNKMPVKPVKAISKKNMTDEEKRLHPTYKTIGGYLKELDLPEAAQCWWDGLSDGDKAIIKAIPNFDANIFEECTGIKTD